MDVAGGDDNDASGNGVSAVAQTGAVCILLIVVAGVCGAEELVLGIAIVEAGISYQEGFYFYAVFLKLFGKRESNGAALLSENASLEADGTCRFGPWGYFVYESHRE